LRVSEVKRNLIANFIGIGWSGFLIVALVPVYVHVLGVEAYGLVGFLLSLQALTAVLDFGLATTVNRELARLTAAEVPARHARSVVRTAELLYWSIAAVIGVVLFAAAPILATRWFTPHDLSPSTISTALRFMAVATALRFPYAVYSAGLYGLQRHTVVNVVLCAAATIRAAGTIALLTLIARDVRLLFAWEMIAAAIMTGSAAAALHRVMPGHRADARLDRNALLEARAFIFGVGAIGILAALTTQVDKLTVSKLLPLSTFGYYTIATTLAATVAAIVAPVFLTAFPLFSQLVARGDERKLAAGYHRAAQTLAVVLLPVVSILFFFGRDIVALWTGNAVVADQTRWLIVLLVIGASLNALMAVPYALQLAHAWTTPALLVNGIGVVVLIPAMVIATEKFGAVGAASCWLAFHLTSFVIGTIMTHHRLLRGHRTHWLWRSVILPAMIALGVCAAGRLFVSGGSKAVVLSWILVTGATAMLATGLSTPVVREWIAEQSQRKESVSGG